MSEWPKAVTAVHLCDCGDCNPEPYNDICKFEVLARELYEALKAADATLATEFQVGPWKRDPALARYEREVRDG